MYFDDLDVVLRQSKCYNYFRDYGIKSREHLRSCLKTNPIANVTIGFAEEMYSEFMRHQRKFQKSQEELKLKDSKHKLACVINDIHIPYQDDAAVKLVFDCIVDTQPDYLILNGDIMDFYGCSKFEKRPDRDVILQSEIDLFYQTFGSLRKFIPNTEIHYVLGNHELRMVNIMKQTPSLWNLDVLEPENLLKLDKLDIIAHKNKFKLNDFIFFHGDVARQDSSYSAKQEFMDHKMQTGISAHTHRLGVYYKTYDMHVTYWYENGCLCELHPEYYKDPTKANWQQGFSMIDMFDGGWNQVTQILIQDHKFIYNGKLYK